MNSPENHRLLTTALFREMTLETLAHSYQHHQRDQYMYSRLEGKR